jgi:2'-5' RNA ligase
MNESSLGKYVIVYLIKGKARQYHKNLVDKIYKNYKVARVTDTVDTHITLKYFNTLLNNKQINETESLLEYFCKNHKKAKLKLKGIGHFDDRVVFIEVKPSKEMSLLYKDLVKGLEKLKWISWHEFEKKNIHFHATLADKGIEDKFEEVFNYAKKYDPEFGLELNNICILKKPRDKWILHKKFLLKD